MTDTTELVPIALLAAEVGQTVDDLAHLLAPDVVRDDLGLRCVGAAVARQVIDDRDQRLIEDAARNARNMQTVEAATARLHATIPAGIPATHDTEGMSAHEVMLAATGGVTPRDEFGRPKPNFLADELDEGQRRRLDESRRT